MSEFAGLSEDLLAVVKELGYTEMTPIQEKTIPLLLGGRDVIGQSRTGSGKTAAFGLPIMQRLELEVREIQALIICPTRELCAQVAREMRRLARRRKGLQVLILAGGEPARPQLEAIRRGVHIAVGTPGRLLDHISRGNLNLEYMKTLVLDEADRMLDMGFEEDMRAIIEATPGTRQTAMFSATFPDQIKAISRKYQHDPVHISIKDKAEATIRQFVFPAENDEKIQLLKKILRASAGSALVFCNQKAAVAELQTALVREDVACDALHGDLEQRDRDQVLALFRNGTTRVLLATDVAARGLDITDLDLVVNFSMPHEAETYVHRVGRTGRAGKAGIAISLATVSERARLHEYADGAGIKIEKGDMTIFGGVSNAVAMETLFISGGRKDKLRPGDILGALTSRLEAKDVGKIEIHDKFAYVAVAKLAAGDALTHLKSGGIKGRKFLVKLLDK